MIKIDHRDNDAENSKNNQHDHPCHINNAIDQDICRIVEMRKRNISHEFILGYEKAYRFEDVHADDNRDGDDPCFYFFFGDH